MFGAVVNETGRPEIEMMWDQELAAPSNRSESARATVKQSVHRALRTLRSQLGTDLVPSSTTTTRVVPSRPAGVLLIGDTLMLGAKAALEHAIRSRTRSAAVPRSSEVRETR